MWMRQNRAPCHLISVADVPNVVGKKEEERLQRPRSNTFCYLGEAGVLPRVQQAVPLLICRRAASQELVEDVVAAPGPRRISSGTPGGGGGGWCLLCVQSTHPLGEGLVIISAALVRGLFLNFWHRQPGGVTI